MADSVQSARRRRVPNPSFAEFVALISFTMGLMSLSIDNLLPAFGAIQASFAIADANEMQLLISAYMIAFALMQIFYGPLSDIIGRRPALMIGLAVYGVGTVIAIFAESFGLLLMARAIQGMGGAAIRVLVVAIVRDRYSGREMARVMSLIVMVFITVPVFAPSIGSLFLWLGGWRLIFVSMLALAFMVVAGFALRMPETLHPEYRFPFSLRRILDGALQTVTTRTSIGYASAMGLTMGVLFGYLNSSQQIFQSEVYGLGPLFPLAFGAIAAVLGCTSFVNSRLVRRLGMRRLAHFGICGFILAAALLLGLALLFAGRPPLGAVRAHAGGDPLPHEPDDDQLQCHGDGAAGRHRRHGLLRHRRLYEPRGRAARADRGASLRRDGDPAGRGVPIAGDRRPARRALDRAGAPVHAAQRRCGRMNTARGRPRRGNRPSADCAEGRPYKIRCGLTP
jgi:DHA1 family bicyclomycin/chloramphenicol resistance-like MFS transporter